MIALSVSAYHVAFREIIATNMGRLRVAAYQLASRRANDKARLVVYKTLCRTP